MLDTILDGLKKERAEFSRNVEYLRETSLDDIIDDRMESAERLFVNESYDELVEATQMLDSIPDEEDVAEESAEIDAIMNAEDNITFNEMVGIE